MGGTFPGAKGLRQMIYKMGGVGGIFRSLDRLRMQVFPRGGGFEQKIRSLFKHLTGRPDTGGMGDMDGGGQEQSQEASTEFLKEDPSGVVRLGKLKFPDSRAKHAWLLLFYDGDAARRDPITQQHIALAKKLSEEVLWNSQNVKNGMLFKVGAVDCGGEALRFCLTKLGDGADIPAFATVLKGSVGVVTDGYALKSAKTLHDHTTAAMSNIDGLVVNISSVPRIRSGLFRSSTASGRPAIAILLLMDTYGTSPLYTSLAYRHRQDGFAAFGESRGSNLQLAKKFSVKKYPTLIALVGIEATGQPRTVKEVSRYDGESMDAVSLSKWVDGLSAQYFKSQ